MTNEKPHKQNTKTTTKRKVFWIFDTNVRFISSLLWDPHTVPINLNFNRRPTLSLLQSRSPLSLSLVHGRRSRPWARLQRGSTASRIFHSHPFPLYSAPLQLLRRAKPPRGRGSTPRLGLPPRSAPQRRWGQLGSSHQGRLAPRGSRGLGPIQPRPEIPHRRRDRRRRRRV